MKTLKYLACCLSGVISLTNLLMMNSLAALPTPPLPPGMPDGGCWSDPVKIVTFSFDGNFTSNKAGAKQFIEFRPSPLNFTSWCYSEDEPPKPGGKPLFYSSTETSLDKDPENPGYLFINESLSVNLKFHAIDPAAKSVPYENDYQFTWSAIINKGINKKDLLNFSSGQAEFLLKKTAIGGAVYVPPVMGIVSTYLYANSGMKSTRPYYIANSTPAIIPVPSECTINNGQTLYVSFGNIDRSLLTADAASSHYHIQKPLTYKCNTSLTQDIKVTLVATPAGYADAIKTSNADIGVVMSHYGRAVAPGNHFSSRLVNGQGSDDVKFTVVKNPAADEIATGQFTNNGTVLIISTL